MKTVVRIFAVLSAFAAFALLGLFTGCATLSKVGDGKLEPVSKATAKAALTAGAAAAPEYAAVLRRIQAQIEGHGEKAAQADQLAGFKFTRTYFMDGSPIPDPSRLTWIDKWEKTESAGEKTPPKESKETASVTADDADDALAAAIAALLEGAE
jgi:hypothetical protein